MWLMDLLLDELMGPRDDAIPNIAGALLSDKIGRWSEIQGSYIYILGPKNVGIFYNS
jgi:hypothetical protein